jgi:hypothetical protein
VALTIEQVRERVETSLSDAALQVILDSCEAEVSRYAGSASSDSETMLASGVRMLPLTRRHASITSIVERRLLSSDPVTLDASDWREVGGYRLLRLSSGTNPAASWGAEVVVTYVPEVDAALRERVTLDLIQMDAEFRAFDSENVGDWSGTQNDYRVRRQGLLSQIREGRSMVYA